MFYYLIFGNMLHHIDSVAIIINNYNYCQISLEGWTVPSSHDNLFSFTDRIAAEIHENPWFPHSIMSYTSSIWHHLLQHRLYQLSYPTTLLTANHICRTFHRCRHSASQINSRQSSDTKASSGDGVVRRSFHSSSVSYVKQSIMLKSEVQRGKNVNVLVDQGWADQIVDMLQTHFDVADPSTVIFDSNTGKYVHIIVYVV